MCRKCQETNKEAYTIAKSCDTIVPIHEPSAAVKEQVQEDKVAAVLPCSIDLLSLIEVLDTPKEHVAIVTMVDNSTPNSASKWCEKGPEPACIQMMFTDTRYSVKRMLDDVNIMMLMNHSTNYNILPARTQMVSADGYAHFCCCGSIACLGSVWRKKTIRDQRRTMIPAAHVIKEDVTAFAPPNVCPLTFRESLGDSNMYDGAIIELLSKQNSPEARKHRFTFQLERQRLDWVIADQSFRVPLLPVAPDDDAESQRDAAESLEQYQQRLADLYSWSPECYVAGQTQPVEALAMRYSIASQRTTSLIQEQVYDTTALNFIRGRSAHCLPLCYNALRATMLRFTKCRRPIRSLPNYSIKLRDRYYGAQTAEDKEVDDESCADHEDWKSADKRNKSPYGVDTELYAQAERAPESTSVPAAVEVDAKILERLDRRFAKAIAACTDKSDCNCLMNEFLANQTGCAICLSCTPRPHAAIYQRMGDSIFTADSPLMSTISATDCFTSLNLLKDVKNGLSKTKTGELQDRADIENTVQLIVEKRKKAADEFTFRPEMLLVDRELLATMTKQLGGFSVVKTKDGVAYMNVRSDILQTPQRAFQAFIERVENRPSYGNTLPYGNVYHDMIQGRTPQEMFQEARRLYPDVASKCRNLSDFVYQLGWHTCRDTFSSIADWLPSFASMLIGSALDCPENTTTTFNRLAAHAKAQERGILADSLIDIIAHELAVTRNMRMVIARLTTQFGVTIKTLSEYYFCTARAVLIVGVCKLYSEISKRIREDALRSITQQTVNSQLEREQAERLKKAEKKLAAEKARAEVKAKREAARIAHEEKERQERIAREEAEAERRRARNIVKRQKKELARQKYEAEQDALKKKEQAEQARAQALDDSRQKLRTFSPHAPEFKPTLVVTTTSAAAAPPLSPPSPQPAVQSKAATAAIVEDRKIETVPTPLPPVEKTKTLLLPIGYEKKSSASTLEKWFQEEPKFKLYDMWGFSLKLID